MVVKRNKVLEGLVKERNWTRGAELGVLRGSTLFYLLDRCPDLTMIGVDSWINKGWVPHNNPQLENDNKQMPKYAEQVKRKAEKYGNRCIILHGDTIDMSEKVMANTLDFVFIDADHSTAHCLADIMFWAPKIKRGGMMLGHDINWPSVERAVRRVFGHYVRLDDNVWAVKKCSTL